MKTSRKLLSRAVLTGLGILCQAGAAFAQDSAPLTIEEILVTADFRSSPDLDIASSVTVMTDERIASRGAQHIEELVNAIPNVNYSAGSNRARFFQIRGIGERSQFVAPINPSVGVLIDDVDFSGAGTIATTMDIEQVEVLRGPQGTRYGANALAGLINIRSKAATEEFDTGLKLGVADYNSSTVSAFVNGALTSSVNGRLAIEQHSSDGFYSNDFLVTSDNNARDELSARAKLAIEVTESWQLDLTLSYVDMDNGYDSFSLDNTRTTLSDEPGFDRQQSTLFAATNSWALAAADVEFIVGLAESDLDYGYDEDWAFDGIHPFGYNSTDRYVRERDTHSFELRALSNDSSRLFADSTQWLVGLYTLSSDETLRRDYTYLDAPFFSDFAFDTLAVYAQLDTQLTDQLTLETGLRLESREANYADSDAAAFAPDENFWGGRIALKYALNDNTLAYGSIARGYKAGGFNTDGTLAPELRSFGEESLVETELGIKSSLFDNTLSLKAAVFHDARRDQQVKSSTGKLRADGSTEFIDYLGNAAEGTNRGLEVEAQWLATSQLSFTVSAGLLDATFDRFINSEQQDLAGRDQAHAPNYMAHIGADYVVGRWSLSASVDAKDGFYFSDSHNIKSDAFELLNLSLRYDADRWSAQLWARNLSNQDVAVRGFFFGAFGNDPRKDYAPEPYLQFGEPRLIGVNLEFAL